MSNRERISANNANIQACIDKANALPNAGGGDVGKTEVEGSFSVIENGEHIFTPDEGKVFSSVKVSVNVPTDSGGGDTETGMEVSKSLFPANCPPAWICPPRYGEGSEFFDMMSVEDTATYMAFGSTAGTMAPGKKYKAIFKPMNSNNLWETFVFGKSDYNSLAVKADNDHIGEYVTPHDDGVTFEFTVPPECALVFLHGEIQYGCRVYEIE